MTTNYKALLEYLGTHYSGWQVQKGKTTVQGTLQAALYQLTGERVSVIGAGRTDSGVHALGQVASFRLTQAPSPVKLLRSLNGILPWDIRIRRLQAVGPDFHAQRQARRKRYCYRIYTGMVLSPFLRGCVYHMRSRLDFEAMRGAALEVKGKQDFSGFAAAGQVRNRVRTVYRSELGRRGHHWCYQIEGDGFLHHMVRNIVGTLLEIGRGRRPQSDVRRILDSRDRRLAGPTAAAHGLYLVRVWYSPDLRA